MPTPLTPDEEFDAHFRRGLEHPSGLPEVPDAPDAWQRMEALLDAEPPLHPPRRAGRGRSVAALLLLLLLIAGLSWHYQPGLRRWATGPAASATPTASDLAARTVRQPAAATSQPPAASQGAGSWQATRSLATAPAGQQAPAQLATATSLAKAAVAASPVAASASSSTSSASVAVVGATKGRRTSTAGVQGDGQPLLVSTEAAGALRRRATGVTAPAARHYLVKSADRKKFTTFATASTPAKNTPHAATGHLTRLAARAADEPGKLRYPADYTPATQPLRRRAGRKAGLTMGIHTSEMAAMLSPAATRRHTRRNGAAQPLAIGTGTRPAANHFTATSAPQHAPLLVPLAAATDLPAQTQAEASGLPEAVAPLAGTGLPGWPADSLPALLPLARVTPFDSLPKPKPLPTNNYRLRIGLLAAPELSAVHQRGTGAGGSAGIQVEYQLARRWRLSTGYLQAIKRYAAGGDDYRVLAAWPSSWALTEVTANCRIIDVPLNLRYDVWQQPQRRAFVSGGLSSLFMRREDYTYQYEVYGKPYTSARQFLNYSNHPFQVLNLSVGYEQNLSPRWALQVEPYLKLPLGGVGYGAVRLQSAGVFFALKYGLLRGSAAR